METDAQLQSTFEMGLFSIIKSVSACLYAVFTSFLCGVQGMLIVSAGGCSITRGARRVPVCWCLVSGFPVRGLIVGGWCVRAGASLHDLPAGCGHSFQCGRRGTGCRSRCLRVFPGVLCAAYGCACLALCRRARIFLQGIPGGARCAASSAGRVSVPLSCRMICGALSAF